MKFASGLFLYWGSSYLRYGGNVAYYSQEKLAGVGGLALDGSAVVFKRRRRNSFEEQLTPK